MKFLLRRLSSSLAALRILTLSLFPSSELSAAFPSFRRMGTCGHGRLRVPDPPDIVFITPIVSSIAGEMRAEDILTITLDGQMVAGEARVPPEVPMHTWVHRSRDRCTHVC